MQQEPPQFVVFVVLGIFAPFWFVVSAVYIIAVIGIFSALFKVYIISRLQVSKILFYVLLR